MAVRFIDLVDTIKANPSNLVNAYNNMIDDSMVQSTTSAEMAKIINGSFAAMHRLNNLYGLDDDGNQVDDPADAIDDFTDVFKHNIILVVNNWRQTQFFQKDDNGKDITEMKFNPINNQLETVQNPTNTAQVAYNLFDINLKADANLTQVSEILKQIFNEYVQYLDVYGGGL